MPEDTLVEEVSVEEPQNTDSATVENDNSVPSEEVLEEGESSNEVSETSTDVTKKEEEKVSKGVSKRIGKLTAKNYTLENEINQLKAKLASKEEPVGVTKPDIDDYDNDSEFQEALIDWKVDKKLSNNKENEIQNQHKQDHQECVEGFERAGDVLRGKHDDYDNITYAPEMVSIYNAAPDMANAIMSSEKGPDIAYYLGNNPDKAVELAKMSPINAAREIGKLEATFSQIIKKKNISSAPEPITPVGNDNPVDKTAPGDNATDKEWLAYRNKTKKIR